MEMQVKGGGGIGHKFYVNRRGPELTWLYWHNVVLLYARLIFQAPPPDNYCTVPKTNENYPAKPLGVSKRNGLQQRYKFTVFVTFSTSAVRKMWS